MPAFSYQYSKDPRNKEQKTTLKFPEHQKDSPKETISEIQAGKRHKMVQKRISLQEETEITCVLVEA